MRLFISYARVDKLQVEELVKILQDAGHIPWFDANLLPGQDWKAILLKEVKACDAFVYTLTPDSVASEWCQWEFSEAVKARKPIIPVLIREKTTIPAAISRYQYADFSEGPTPRVIARLLGGLHQIAITVPAADAPDAPRAPEGIPARVPWTEQAKRYRPQTTSQRYMTRITPDESRQLRRTHHRQAVKLEQGDTIIGIDFGTTNSMCAVMQNGQPVTIPNGLGYTATPSAVGIGLDGQPIVGEPALKFALQYPERSVLEVKRLFGHDLALEVDNQQYDPALLASYVLRSLKEDAEAYLGAPITSALCTAPASFDEIQLDYLRKAANLAGLHVVRIVPEPTAACLGSGIDPNRYEVTQEKIVNAIAVYDLGGGTFDISILDASEGVFEVRAINGDTQLGGLDFDRIIAQYCLEQFFEETGVDLRDNPAAEMRVREAAEKAKIILSTAQHTTVDVPYIYGDQSGAYNLCVPLSRARFNELTYHLVEKTIACCQQALNDANLRQSSWNQIEAIDMLVLVGLATKTPSVVETVSRFFNAVPIRGVDPDQAVVLGAALQAGVLMGQVSSFLLLDATPHTLSVETGGNTLVPLVSKHTTIPTMVSRSFTTIRDNQTHAIIHILQGDAETAADNTSLAQIVFDGIPPAPKGIPSLVLTLDVDTDSGLTLTIQEEATGRKRTETITRGAPIFETLPGGVVGDLVSLR
ncbi:MAG: Hsp70 family protein [Anaerolineae bacterium]|nr:Hsp70 family protein [Anaerolineae bacterium]